MCTRNKSSDTDGTQWEAVTEAAFISDAEEVSFQITEYVDLAGNTAITEAPRTSDDNSNQVRIDLSKPTISPESVWVSTDNKLAGTDPEDAQKYLAKDGDTITLEFSTSEPLSSAEVVINGEKISARKQDGALDGLSLIAISRGRLHPAAGYGSFPIT